MTLSIQRVDDFFEAQKITDEGQILAIACFIRVHECSGDEVAKFANVAHVNATQLWIKRKSPAHGSACLLVRSKNAHKILIVERRDDERVICKPSFSNYPINLGLTSKVGNVQLAFADRFDVREGGPDEVLDAGFLGGAYGSRCLLQFVRSVLLEVSYQKYAIRPIKCGCKGFGAIQVCFDDFVGKLAMLGRIASQGAYLELFTGLKGAYHGASLLPGCADDGDDSLICGFHMQCASLFHYPLMPILLT